MATLVNEEHLPDSKPNWPNGVLCLSEARENEEDVATVWLLDPEEPAKSGDACENCGSSNTRPAYVFGCHTDGTLEGGCHDPGTHIFEFDGHIDPEAG